MKDSLKIQLKKDIAYADKKYRKMEKHNNTKIPVTVESFMYMLDDCSDNARLELIKGLIWSADDMEKMWKLVCDKIANKKFEETLD